jgi:hypothetical protein
MPSGAAAGATVSGRHWRACTGSYVGAPDGWRHVFDSIRVRMQTVAGAIQCSDGRYVARETAASYGRRGLLPSHPAPYVSCSYRDTRSGVEHATCRIYTDMDLVQFSVRPR